MGVGKRKGRRRERRTETKQSARTKGQLGRKNCLFFLRTKGETELERKEDGGVIEKEGLRETEIQRQRQTETQRQTDTVRRRCSSSFSVSENGE